MEDKMQNCPRCSRLFSSESGHSYCQVCYAQAERDEDIIEDSILIHHKGTAEELAEFTYLPLKRVQYILEQMKGVSFEGESETTCTKCRKRNAMVDSKYCLPCHLGMYRSLGDEAEILEETIAKGSETKRVSLHDVLMEKRSRTAHNRFNPVPKSIKGGR